MEAEAEKVKPEEKDVHVYRYGAYTVRVYFTGEKTLKECLENIAKYVL